MDAKLKRIGPKPKPPPKTCVVELRMTDDEFEKFHDLMEGLTKEEIKTALSLVSRVGDDVVDEVYSMTADFCCGVTED